MSACNRCPHGMDDLRRVGASAPVEFSASSPPVHRSNEVPSPMTSSTRLLRALLVTLLVGSAAGVAVSSADELPTSGPDVYLTATESADLAKSGYDGTGVTVAVIDTGVADVPLLHGKVIHQVNLSAAPPDGDQYGHGTFVAGLVHAAAPGAEIVSIKLSGANGAVDVTQVLAALQWVVVNKDRFSIDVVNLSFGNDSKQSAQTSPLNFAVQRAWDAGIVVVASAGNLGSAAGTVTKPGDDPLIISVGATDDAGTARLQDDAVAAYGSRGPTQDGLAKPDIVAPGTRVVSLRAPGSTADTEFPQARVGDDHFRGSGTSFSAPLVSGIVAQMLQADPTLTPDRVKYGLLSTGVTVDGDPAAIGSGSVAALHAVAAASEGMANIGAVRSSGRGSLQESRGSAVVSVRSKVVDLDGTVVPVDVALDGDLTAEVVPAPEDAPSLLDGATVVDAVDPFDPAAFVDTTTWEASQWGASQWGASQWGASQWGASQWGASQWGSSQWWASQWG